MPVFVPPSVSNPVDPAVSSQIATRGDAAPIAPAAEMTVAAMMLADYAAIREGLLHMVGGGVVSLAFGGQVGQLGRDLVVFVETGTGGTYELVAGVCGPDGGVLVEGVVGVFESGGGVVPHVVSLREVALAGPGLHVVSVGLNGTWVANLGVQVELLE